MSPSSESDRVVIEHMLEQIRNIQEDAQNGRDEFFESHTLQRAVTYSL